MTSLVEPLIALGVGLILGLTSLMRPRSKTDIREQIKQDIEIRGLLDTTTERDDIARDALTQSIRKNALRTIQEEPDWYDRWGSEWLVPLGLILFFVGMNLRAVTSRSEVAPETQLTIEAIATTSMVLGGPLIGIWAGRTLTPLVVERFRARMQRRKDRQKDR